MNSSPTSSLTTVLVSPPRQGGVECLFTFHKNEGIGHRPPLGILTLATHLRENGFPSTHCVDAQLDDLTPEQTAEQVATFNPDVVGLSVWTDFWYPAWRTVQLIRQRLPDCRIVLGGPHCLVYPHESLEHSDVDYVIVGDGEETLLSLITSLNEGREPGDLPGLLYKRDGRIVEPSTRIAVVKDLDRIAIADRTLLPYARYNSVLNPSEYETTMISSRGCPHRCTFCKMHAQKVQACSAGHFVEELARIESLGITDVQVYDDTFTWSRQRVIDICHGILDRGIKVRWAIRDRANKADAEVYKLMRKAGCYRIHFGVESGSPIILKATGKAITLDQARHALKLAKQAGFTTMAYYMFGFLDETYADALKTIRFARQAGSDYAVFAVLIPYPGTSLYNEALQRKIITYDFWRNYACHPVPDFSIPQLIEQHLNRDTLIALKDKALRSYYFRPARVARELVRLRSWKDFQQKTSMAFNIMTDSLGSLKRIGQSQSVRLESNRSSVAAST